MSRLLAPCALGLVAFMATAARAATPADLVVRGANVIPVEKTFIGGRVVFESK